VTVEAPGTSGIAWSHARVGGNSVGTSNKAENSDNTASMAREPQKPWHLVLGTQPTSIIGPQCPQEWNIWTLAIRLMLIGMELPSTAVASVCASD
jgi:hypothetical protein